MFDYAVQRERRGRVSRGTGPIALSLGPDLEYTRLMETNTTMTDKQKLYDIIADWWGDAETQDKDPIIADLVDDIEKWLQKEQSTTGGI